jgi:hypothetical protein
MGAGVIACAELATAITKAAATNNLIIVLLHFWSAGFF